MTVLTQQSDPPTAALLRQDERMAQPEFHRRYSQMPPSFKAELIEGVVHVPSPTKCPHASFHHDMAGLLSAYQAQTPGVRGGATGTVILGKDSEPQPDLLLRIEPRCGGRCVLDDDDYLRGPPELVVEIAHSSRAIDLHAKRRDYTRYGVQEYLVLDVRDRKLHCFDLLQDAPRTPDTQGVLRVRRMPGLWIDTVSLFADRLDQCMATLQQGLQSPEHADFVKRLAEAKAAHDQV